jgi:hypothetical protein
VAPHRESQRQGQRLSITTLLSNYACQVVQRGATRLYCTCRGNIVTGILVLGAAVAALSVVTTMLLVEAGGDSRKGLFGVALGLILAGGSTHMAIQRYQRHGRFELDGERGVLRRFRAGRLTGEYRFDQVRRVWLTVDATDTIGLLQGTPSWLQVALSTGEIFRLAKGSRLELEPVCDAMREVGLTPRVLAF